MFSHSFYTAGGDINVKFYNTLQFNVGGDILYFNTSQSPDIMQVARGVEQKYKFDMSRYPICVRTWQEFVDTMLNVIEPLSPVSVIGLYVLFNVILRGKLSFIFSTCSLVFFSFLLVSSIVSFCFSVICICTFIYSYRAYSIILYCSLS